jgi:hypothetical protein
VRLFASCLALTLFLLLAPRGAEAQNTWKPGMGKPPLPGQWVPGQQTRKPVPAPTVKAEAKTSGPIKGGHNSALMMDVEQNVKLLSDPRLSDDARKQIESELVREGIDAVAPLVTLATRPPTPGAMVDLRPVSERMLYRIVVPSSGAERPAWIVIKDWSSWWVARERRSLADIHTEINELHLEYQRTGDIQNL